jgi:hypothetical protein
MAQCLLGKEGDGAIVVSFETEHEHPPIVNALVTSFFHFDFFRGKYSGEVSRDDGESSG